MRRVIIESPYAGDVDANVEYARRCVRDSLSRGEAPIASHLLYTQPGILRDEIPDERQWGIDAGLAWRGVAEASVVYIDRGITPGMEYGIKAAAKAGVPSEFRTLGSERSAGDDPIIAERAVVSDDNETIRLSSYRGGERAALATVELAPMSAIRLANELIAAALRHAARVSTAALEIPPIIPRQADGCCHQTVRMRCKGCPYEVHDPAARGQA